MNIAFCADLHIGNPNTSLQELLTNFEEMVSSSDLIVIGGDTLDSRFYASSENVSILLQLMEFLTPIISAHHKSLRILYGTQSHDGYPQLQILLPYTHRMDFKLIPHVTEETICHHSILYLPEEIIEDKTSYYQSTLFSGKKYDYIFGHGVIQELMSMVKPSSIPQVKTVPIFTLQDLKQATNICALFGHYHVHTMSGNIGYVGSLTRFRHSEHERKGWYHITDKTLSFIPNPHAPTFTEYKINCSDYTLDSLQSFLTSKIRSFQDNYQPRDQLKFNIYMDSTIENYPTWVEHIRSSCQIDGVRYSIHREQSQTPVQLSFGSSDYLLDRNISVQDKINRYNDTVFGEPLDQNLLSEYLEKVGVQLRKESHGKEIPDDTTSDE